MNEDYWSLTPNLSHLSPPMNYPSNAGTSLLPTVNLAFHELIALGKTDLGATEYKYGVKEAI